MRETPEEAGWIYEFDVKRVRGGRDYEDIISMLDNDRFIFKSEYNAARQYLESIKAKQQKYDDFFAGLL